MTELFARPYRTDIKGFSFKTTQEYAQEMDKLCLEIGGEPLDAEIQFIGFRCKFRGWW